MDKQGGALERQVLVILERCGVLGGDLHQALKAPACAWPYLDRVLQLQDLALRQRLQQSEALCV